LLYTDEAATVPPLAANATLMGLPPAGATVTGTVVDAVVAPPLSVAIAVRV